MRSLRIFTYTVAVLIALGEVARWWGNERFLPMALDELLVAFALVGAAAAAGRAGPAPLAAAWGIFCGLTLALLMPTMDHLLHGPPKESAVFYTAILSGMLGVGLWALSRSLAIVKLGSVGTVR